jgi:hypothetical protein
VPDEDTQHAWRNAIRGLDLDLDEGFTMLIGPDTTGQLLEVGVLDIEGDDPVAIHSMPARPKFLRAL